MFSENAENLGQTNPLRATDARSSYHLPPLPAASNPSTFHGYSTVCLNQNTLESQPKTHFSADVQDCKVVRAHNVFLQPSTTPPPPPKSPPSLSAPPLPPRSLPSSASRAAAPRAAKPNPVQVKPLRNPRRKNGYPHASVRQNTLKSRHQTHFQPKAQERKIGWRNISTLFNGGSQ